MSFAAPVAFFPLCAKRKRIICDYALKDPSHRENQRDDRGDRQKKKKEKKIRVWL